MTGRVDLDKTLALLADAGTPTEECDPDAYMAAALQDARDMVAELRAAREVVNQTRLQSRPHVRLRAALTAYDEVVGS